MACETIGAPAMTTARLPIALLAVALELSACTGPAALLAALIPDGTTAVMLGNLEKVTDENRRAVAELEQAGRWDELARLSQENLAKDRANADWWLVLGYARSQLGQYAAAADAFGTAVRLEPDASAGWHLLAQAYRAAGEPHRAVNALNNALTATRDSPMTFFLLGESYTDLRRYEDAAAAYREAVRAHEQFPAAWFALARTYARLGRVDDARAARSRLQELDPQLAARLEDDASARELPSR